MLFSSSHCSTLFHFCETLQLHSFRSYTRKGATQTQLTSSSILVTSKQVLEKIFKKVKLYQHQLLEVSTSLFIRETVNSSRTESSQVVSCSTLLQNWMLDKGQLHSSGNPRKVWEVEIRAMRGARTCSRKAQNGAAQIER